MRRLSTVAAIACVGIIGIGLTGCGGGGGGSIESGPVVTNEACPVPQSAKQAITFSKENDFENVKGILTASIIALRLGYYMPNVIGGEKRYKTVAETDEKSLLENYVGQKIVNLQKNALSLSKEIRGSGVPFEVGEEIHCDNYSDENQTGFYNATYSDAQEEDGYDISIEFKNCLLNASDERGEIFWDLLWENSPLDMFSTEASSNILLFNGDFAMQMRRNSSISEVDSEDENSTFSLNVSKENLSFLYADGITEEKIFEYQGDGTLKLQATYQYSYNETEDPYEEVINETGMAHLSMNLDEKMDDYEDNSSIHMQALCYSATNTYTYTELENEEYREAESEKVESNGYIWLASKSEDMNFSADIYTKNYVFDESWIKHRGEGVDEDVFVANFNGSVGSSLVGGSAMLNTTLSWKWDNSGSRASSSSFMYDIFDIGGMEMPDEGRTLFTGTNSAIISFQHNESNETNGTITVGEDSGTYENMDQMLIELISG